MDYKNIDIKRQLYKNYSLEVVTEKEYNLVHSHAVDSLENWASNSLKSYLNEKYNPWNLDSLICFNKNADKCVMVISKQNTLFKEALADGITHFYGLKINEEWYFFDGPYLVLPRSSYSDDENLPLSFSELRSIAMDTIFKGYLKKNKDGKWEINDNFFVAMENKNNPSVTTGYGSCFECKSFEEYVLYRVRKNWEKRDTTDYKSL